MKLKNLILGIALLGVFTAAHAVPQWKLARLFQVSDSGGEVRLQTAAVDGSWSNCFFSIPQDAFEKTRVAISLTAQVTNVQLWIFVDPDIGNCSGDPAAGNLSSAITGMALTQTQN